MRQRILSAAGAHVNDDVVRVRNGLGTRQTWVLTARQLFLQCGAVCGDRAQSIMAESLQAVIT